MSYFRLLGLSKEPFSTSPDPDFLYESSGHHATLVRLMIEVRLKRGMSLVLGDVGIGKTTLARKLYQMLRTRKDILFHMILDPVEGSELSFLISLVRTFNLPVPQGPCQALDCKDVIKKYLFQKGVAEGKTIVLLIDEGQKLDRAALEVLRTLLNYETNDYKLLQLVVFAQMEFLPTVTGMRNLWDRISFRHALAPLDIATTRQMIDFRLRQAGYRFARPLFSDDAVEEIHAHAQGCPRRIAMLCHKALQAVVLLDNWNVDAQLVRSVCQEDICVGV
jgi:general secretion pathway protein A